MKNEVPNQHLADRQAGKVDEFGNKLKKSKESSEKKENIENTYESDLPNTFLEARQKGLIDEHGNKLVSDNSEEESDEQKKLTREQEIERANKRIAEYKETQKQEIQTESQESGTVITTHVLTEEDFELNPELAKSGLKVGDEIDLSDDIEEESK